MRSVPRPDALGLSRRGLLAAAFLACTAAPLRAREPRVFRIATGGISGTYYPVGNLVASVVNARPCGEGEGCGVPGLIAVVLSSRGSVANIEAIEAGQVESGFAQADIAHYAYRGEGPFAGRPMRRIRALARLYNESLHLVVMPDSGIVTLAQLPGKRLSLDEPGSGTLFDVRLLFEALGLTERDIRPVYVKPAVALSLMARNELDGFFLIAGYPAPSVVEATGRLAAGLVAVIGAAVERLLQRHPFFVRDVIPAGVYPAQPAVPTIGVGALWLVSADLEEELVHELARALFDPAARPLLDRGHPKGREIRLENALDSLSVPLHPGAERYYREHGLL